MQQKPCIFIQENRAGSKMFEKKLSSVVKLHAVKGLNL